jgi:flagellar basal body-associated protein FliL
MCLVVGLIALIIIVGIIVAVAVGIAIMVWLIKRLTALADSITRELGVLLEELRKEKVD